MCRRALWGLHRCLALFEHATFACSANERALVALCVPGWPSGGATTAVDCTSGGASAPAAAGCSPSPGEGTEDGASGASAEAWAWSAKIAASPVVEWPAA